MIKTDEAGQNNLSGRMEFALPRLISRAEEGSGEECGQGFGLGVFENSTALYSIQDSTNETRFARQSISAFTPSGKTS